MITDKQLTKAIKHTGFSLLTLYIIEIITCVILKANGTMEMSWRGVLCLFIATIPVGLTIYAEIYKYFAKKNENDKRYFN